MTCTWEPDTACLGEKWATLDEDVKQRSLMLATSTLQNLTLNRVGTCPIKIRPCPEPLACRDWRPHRWMDQGRNYGQWFSECGCTTAHWCAPLSEIDLAGPVGYVASVRVDGLELDIESGDWRLDNGHLLVWQGVGPSPIPRTQNLDKPDTEVGTWSVTYSKSYPVNEDARIAVALLAVEFAEACKPKGKCSLPRGVTNVVRNGVTFTVDAGMFVNGLTGIQIVDAFIMKWAPPGSPSRSASVYTPGKAPVRRTNSVPTRAPSPYVPQPGGGFGQ